MPVAPLARQKLLSKQTEFLPDLGELINHTEIGNYPHCLSNPNPL